MPNRLYQETQKQNVDINYVQQLMQQNNIPNQYQNSPRQAVEYLVQSGKISQDSLNRVMQMVQNLGVRL